MQIPESYQIPKTELENLISNSTRSTVTQIGLLLSSPGLFEQKALFAELMQHPAWPLLWPKLITQFSDEDLTLLNEMLQPVSQQLCNSLKTRNLRDPELLSFVRLSASFAEYPTLAALPDFWFGAQLNNSLPTGTQTTGKDLQQLSLLGAMLHFSALVEESVFFILLTLTLTPSLDLRR
jgi:hypothetical protein